VGLIDGEGTDEATWRVWLQSHPAPAPAFAIEPRQRLVVVAPHPDDEVLACGGLLAQHVAARGRCLIVALTDGEAFDGTLAPSDRGRVVLCRQREREAGLRRLGVTDPHIQLLGLPDGALCRRESVIERALHALLRDGDVLVTTWEHDGHPDHEAAGRSTRRVAAQTGLAVLSAPVWMWHWARPDDPRVPWSRLVSLSLTDEQRQRKQAALAAHQSQLMLRTGDAPPVLGNAALQRVARVQEHYFA
jgi:LmbE family N-acetylglucosaminyl deacetylase